VEGGGHAAPARRCETSPRANVAGRAELMRINQKWNKAISGQSGARSQADTVDQVEMRVDVEFELQSRTGEATMILKHLPWMHLAVLDSACLVCTAAPARLHSCLPRRTPDACETGRLAS
jgi:hypothetical protein